MPKKVQSIDWNTYLDAASDKQMLEEAMKQISELEGRTLYELDTISLVNKYIINRPIDHAMAGTVTNYPNVDPIDSMTDLLVDGESFYRVEDYTHIRREEFVYKAEVDRFTGQIYYIYIAYPIDKGLWYIESYTPLYTPGSTTTCMYTIYNNVSTMPEDLSLLTVAIQLELPFFPYVRVEWKGGRSFLDDLSESILRLEMAYRVVAQENIDRKTMALYLEGVRSTDEIKRAPKKLGRNIHTLPPGATFHAPTSDGAILDLMKWEITDLWNNLEKASGVVSTEKLASLSGVSRIIAQKPLNNLSNDIRHTYEDLLNKIYELIIFQNPPVPKVSYKRLNEIESPTEYRATIELAHTAGAITDEEYIQLLRTLLDLTN
jgi:hypothetical protein